MYPSNPFFYRSKKLLTVILPLPVRHPLLFGQKKANLLRSTEKICSNIARISLSVPQVKLDTLTNNICYVTLPWNSFHIILIPGEIIATDSDGDCVKIISPGGQQITKLDCEIYCAAGVAVDSKDNIIVTDWKDRIRVSVIIDKTNAAMRFFFLFIALDLYIYINI